MFPTLQTNQPSFLPKVETRMTQVHQLVFGPFRLDPVTDRLWRGDEPVELQPRPLAVLRYLTQRPGQVVTKEELLKHVWAGTYVTKTVLKVCVQAIREALGRAR